MGLAEKRVLRDFQGNQWPQIQAVTKILETFL